MIPEYTCDSCAHMQFSCAPAILVRTRESRVHMRVSQFPWFLRGVATLVVVAIIVFQCPGFPGATEVIASASK